MQGASLSDDPALDAQNAEVIAHFKDQKVNVYYDRVLSAVNNGTWARFTSEDNPDAKLNAFRGYYLADAAENAARRAPAVQDVN